MAQDYGIKVAKPGFDILTAALKDQVFNSAANSLKIWMIGSVNITTTGVGSTTNSNIAHNLGYEPFFYTYWLLKDANKLWFQDGSDESRLTGNFNFGFAKADATNLIMSVFTDEASNYTATGFYVIFIDKSFE